MIALRSLLFTALFYVWSLAFSLMILPLLLAPSIWMVRSLSIWSAGINFLLKICCGITVEVRGKQFIPTGPALVAPKHQSMQDTFAQFGILPRGGLFVIKKELMWIPFFAWYVLKMGGIVVDRAGHSAALKSMVAQAKLRFQQNRQLIIFPEGTRGEPGTPGDYKPGIAALYRELELPVHPVATNSGVHWPAHGFLRKPGIIVFEFLEPIPPGLKRGEFMRLLQERIEPASQALLLL